MGLNRRQTLKVLGGTGAVVTIGAVGGMRFLSAPAMAQAQFEVEGASAETEDGTVEDILLADGEGEIIWENMDPTFIDIWLGASPEGYDSAWGWDPQISADDIPDGNTLDFDFDDLFTRPLSLSDSPGGGIDLSIFEPDEDEDERSTTLQFRFEVNLSSDTEDVQAVAEDTATIVISRANSDDDDDDDDDENDDDDDDDSDENEADPSASIVDAEFELEIET